MKDKIIHKAENLIYLILTVIVLFYVVFQIVELTTQFVNAIRYYNFGSEVIENIWFSNVVMLFFNILISLEIMETFKKHDNNIWYKVKIIILIAITAMTRKIITIDVKHMDYLTDIGIASLILSLCVGYYFISKNEKKDENEVN
jgi:uncharacterized membrane protein (DUF373 family)